MSGPTCVFAPEGFQVDGDIHHDLEQPTIIMGGLGFAADSAAGERADDPIAPFAREAAQRHDSNGFYEAIKRAREADPHASFATFTGTSYHHDQSMDDY